MTPESFLSYQTLRKAPTQTGIEPWLIELEERGNFSAHFCPFPEKDREKLDAVASHIASLLEAAKIANTDNWYPREPVNFAKHLQKTKRYEIAGLLQASGVTEDENWQKERQEGRIDLYDLCGGAGAVSVIAAYMRGKLGKTTRIICVEHLEHLRRKHEAFAKAFAPDQETELRVQDVRDVDITPQTSPIYLLAKHACGPATDRLVEVALRAIQERKGQVKAYIISCCHGAVGPRPVGAVAMGLTQEEWQRLGRTADWVQHPKKSHAEVGRVAMRIMDSMRLSDVPEGVRRRVMEICPPTISHKNHALVLESINNA